MAPHIYNVYHATQTWNAAGYAANAGFGASAWPSQYSIFFTASREKDSRLGCGDGVLTEKLTALNVQVVGVDSSPDMVLRQESAASIHMWQTPLPRPLKNEFDAVFPMQSYIG